MDPVPLALTVAREAAADASTASVLALLGLVAAGIVAVMLAERLLLTPRRLLTPEDAVGTPGQPVTLRAWVERDLFFLVDPPVAGVAVRFRIGDRELASTTDAQGKAEAVLASPPAGLHRVFVVCDGALPEEALIEISDKPA